MFRQLGILGTALAFFSIAGGHWAVLQSVAWAGMLADYSQSSGSVVIGFEQTFDGQHACDLCRAIQTEKGKERRGSDASPGVKDDAKVKAISTAVPAKLAASAPVEVAFLPLVPSRMIVREEPPPTPPPRRTARVA